MTVPQTTLDILLDRRGIGQVDLVKIDAEGAELDILRGGSRSLDRVDRVVIAAYHFPGEERLCRDYLRGRGFEVSTRSVDGDAYISATRRHSRHDAPY